MESWHWTCRGKDPTLLTELCNVITRKWGIKEDDWGEYQKGIYTGVKVTSWCPSHLHEKEGQRTAGMYKLLTTKCYYCEELLLLTLDHWIARLNLRNILFHKVRPVRYLQPSIYKK